MGKYMRKAFDLDVARDIRMMPKLRAEDLHLSRQHFNKMKVFARLD